MSAAPDRRPASPVAVDLEEEEGDGARVRFPRVAAESQRAASAAAPYSSQAGVGAAAAWEVRTDASPHPMTTSAVAAAAIT